jgi:hypothetical protein
MTFNIAILMQAEGSDARAEIAGVGNEAKKTSGAVKGMGTASKTTSTQTKGLGSSADQTEARIKGLTSAATQNAAATKALGNANRVAAGQTANLVAQGNDVMVMMMAGQNGLQLGMQQGTQIAQVIGPMGAAGAFKALGSAVMGMLNPISLLTIGGLAAGATMLNWLRDSREAGVSFSETLEDVKTKVSDYKNLISNKNNEFATNFDAAKHSIEQTSQAYSDLIALAKLDAFQSIEMLNKSLVSNVVSASWTQTATVDTGDLLGIDTQLHGHIGTWKDAREQVHLFMDDLNNLKNAGSLDAQYDAAVKIRDRFSSTVDVTGEMTEMQTEFWRNLSQSVYQMELLGAATNTSKTAYQEYYQSRIASEQYLAKARAAELQEQAKIYGFYAQTRMESDAAATSAQTEITSLQQQTTLQAVVAQYGADSTQAVALRVSYERQAYEASLATRDVSQSTKDELMASWDAANGLASVDTAANLSRAADQASKIANELARAVDNAISLSSQGVGTANRARINYEFREDPIGKAGALARAEFDARTELPDGADSTLVNTVEKERREFVSAQVEAARYTEQLRDWQKAQNEAARSGSGAAKATDQQRKATNDLISGLQDELAILQVTDPVQKELLRNREALTGATDAQRQTIGDLIAQRNQETQTLAQQSETWTELRSTAYGFFSDLRSSGGDLEQTFANLANGIADMVMQAALLGEGPLAGILGGGDGGGLIGTALSAIFPALAPAAATAIPARAEGGMVHGKGGPKSDQVLMWGSNGEFMMNAKATAKNRHLLEVLNAGGSLPGLANGGAINGSQSSGASVINILPMNNSSVPLNMEVEETTDARGQKTLKVITSDMVAKGMTVRGGKAERVMQSKFGARKQGIGRS